MQLSPQIRTVLSNLLTQITNCTAIDDLNKAHEAFDEKTLELERDAKNKKPVEDEYLNEVMAQVELGIAAYNATSLKNQLNANLPDKVRPASTRAIRL